MSSDSFASGDQEIQKIIDRLQNSQAFLVDAHAHIHPRIERRIRTAVFERIEERARMADWLLRPLWRPVLAALLPFATGLAFGQSDYLIETPLHLQPEQSIHLVTSIDAADGLLRYFAAQEGGEAEVENVE